MAEDSDSDDGIDGFGPQSPPLTDQIASVLRRYPDGGQILKELIQNADDAGAQEVRFLLDQRSHSTEDLYDSGLSNYQGPALYAWNDAVFKKEDWKFLGKIEQSGKKKEVLKVGRFGLGFLSVFHMTDLPMVISRKYVGITDPHRGLQVVPEGGAGIQIKLDEFMKHQSHAVCFSGVFEMSAQVVDYRATLFRFPLRTDDAVSKISKNCYTPDKVLGNLFASLQEEASILLLFLRNVVKVSMYEWNETTHSPDCLFRIEINGNIRKNREGCTNLAKCYNKTSSKTSIIISSMSTTTCEPPAQSYKVHNWLVMNAIGSDCGELRERAQKTSVLPWVGIAAPTLGDLNIQALQFELHDISSGSESFEELLSKLSGQTQKIVFEDSKFEVRANTSGQAFCFLPLPGGISLPVNLHGYFAVADNRRSIKWPSHDEKGEEAKWNELLLLKLVSPLYALMLACRSTLVEYSGPTCDAYAAWPIHAEVKNQQIWAHVLNPVLDQIRELPVFWAATQNGGKWVTLKQASFFIDANDNPPQIVLRKLKNAGYSIVHLPQNILETMLSNDDMKNIITKRYMKPSMVRKALKNENGLLISDEQEEVYEMLRYILDDKPDLISLRDLEVLPLNSSSEFAAVNGKKVFLFPQKNKDALTFLPGISSSIIDVKIPLDLQLKLEDIAQQDQSSLTLVTASIICSDLLTLSMKSWYPTFARKRECLWEPGRLHHPPLQWISDIWLWIQTHNAVQDISNIPLVPTEVISESTNQVTLVCLDSTPELCTLPTKGLPCSPDDLLSIVRKIGVIHIPKSEYVFNCPGTMQFIKPVDAHLILKHVRKLQSLSLTDSARDCLREYISNELLSSKLTQDKVGAIKTLKIFKAGVGGSVQSYVSLANSNCILPPHGLSFEETIQYPSNILCDGDHCVTVLLEKLHIPRSESIDEFCKKVILPQATKQYPLSSNDERLIMWVLQCPLSRPAFLADFSIIKPCTSDSLQKPTNLYDPQENVFCRLYDREKDPVFPDSAYDSVLHVLRQAGLITWSYICSEREKMIAFFRHRAQSISSLSKSAGLERSKYLLHLLLNNNIVSHFSDIPFLFTQQVPPACYPSSLEWCGNSYQEAICPRKVCITESDALVVGSVVPVASSEYQLHGSCDGFHLISSEERVCHFNKVVQYKPSTEDDLEKYHNVIMKVYLSLIKQFTGICKLPLAWIWWRSRKEFLRPDQCVFSLPPDIGSLEPYLFNLCSNTDLQVCVKALLPKVNSGIQQSMTRDQAILVLGKMKRVEKLTSGDIQISIRILNWLKSLGPHTYGDILVPTSLKTLVSMSECTYDDRNWSTKVQKSKYTFVHEDVSPALAKHFNVIPLSRKVAPSQNLKLKYTKAGQKEPVTRRIKRIVEDYATSSDIFKELLQNADDAQATEVKFLIDWRKHPTSSLFTEELANWQGPALIAYNNAKFSDQDFEHICELAGETKMKDPLKTGRFGVGFCATYRLTDVPSFISRRFFTMFDPHTTYLGDRVSAGEPGMRIDLVDNKEDLLMYEDQFKPFEGLFGCNVFDLFEDGFQGTIFRFPFRSNETANKSNICQDILDANSVNELMQTVNKEASHLLLFLKHIQKVSLYIFEENANDMQQKLEICRECYCSPACTRVSLLNPCMQTSINICHCKITKEGNEPHEVSHWILCSAVSPSVKEEKQRGLIPFAEVAIPVKRGEEGMLFPLSVVGYTFCFLPLPKKTGLPFHINGYFEIGRDRSDLKTSDDGRFGKDWNDALCKEPLTYAFISGLSELARMSPLSRTISLEKKETYLRSYYNLLMLSDNAGLKSFHSSLTIKLPQSEKLIIWSDVEGGKWLRPKDIVILNFSSSVEKILKPAMDVLLYLNYKICNLPDHVSCFLIQHLRKSKRKQVFTCQEFYTEVMLRFISRIPNDIRDEHITFLLKTLDRHKWIAPLLQKYRFVPVEGCNVLISPKEVIDAKNPLMMSLFDPEDGRFPKQFIQDDGYLMLGLRQLGMPVELSVEEIQGRARTVVEIPNKAKALKRAWSIVSYVQSKRYGINKHKLSSAVGGVCFLPVDCKPQNCQIAWWEGKRLVEPKSIFTPQWNNLVFSVCPVVAPPDEYKLNPDIFPLFGASEELPLSLVISHLLTLSEASVSFDEGAIEYVSKAVKETYKFLHMKLQYIPEHSVVDVKKRIAQKGFIWQGNKFLRADQVVMVWNKDQYPYLCALSSENHEFKEFFSKLGVKEQPSAESLADILRQIAGTTGLDTGELTMPVESDRKISHNTIDFIEEVVKKLSQLVEMDKNKLPQQLYLPDEYGVMRPVEHLACDKVSDNWVQSLDLFASQAKDGTLHFLNENIPRNRAIKLGVKPLLDTLLQGLEDNEFMRGIDYGQHEDLCDRLRSILSKYPSDHSILNEFVQNADDAHATEIVFILDHRKFPSDKLFPSRHQKWKDLQETPALLIVNNSKFTEEDIQGIAKLGRGGKQNASDTIGRFGIGFNVAYHVTDCPSFVTFSEKGEPENFCVFDPTCSFANTTKHFPGKRWKISCSKVVTDLPDQFQPYLLNDVETLMEDLDKAHVVFRLPLTRKPVSMSKSSYESSPFPYRTHPGVLHFNQQKQTRLGTTFTTHKLKQLFVDMESYARETLLFLNHVQKISAVEITESGQVVKYFNTRIIMSPEVRATCTMFAKNVKEITQRPREAEQLSLTYEMEILHKAEVEECQKWLVCKQFSPGNIVQHDEEGLEDCSSEWNNMRPIGGVAAALGTQNIKGLLFCFLPLPLKNMLPVHVNGHFLIDDSRKHLEQKRKESTNWNISLAKNVLAPCYVDMLMHAQKMTQIGKAKEEWFYKLFPPSLNIEGEVANLKLPQQVFKILHQRNPPILLQKHPDTASMKWLTLTGKNMGYFFRSFLSNETSQFVEPDPELRCALIHLAMPVVTSEVPLSLYDNFNHLGKQSLAYVTPELIVDHLKNRAKKARMKEILTVNTLQLLIQFIIDSKGVKYVKGALSSVPLLLTSNNHLWSGKTIFKSNYASLLPHSSGHFILPELEESPVGILLADNGVIVDLTVEFVRDNIELSDTKVPVNIANISNEKFELVKTFWLYMKSSIIHGTMKDNMEKHFKFKPLLPTDDKHLYPMSLSSTIVSREIKWTDNNIRSALKKLGYPTISFEALELSGVDYRGLVNPCLCGRDIIDCFKLKAPLIHDVDLSNSEVRRIIESLRDHPELTSFSTTLRRLKIFMTVSGEFMAMKGNVQVFVLPHDVPRGGIESIQEHCKSNFVILDATDKLTMDFYKQILNNIGDEKVKIYRNVILPHLHQLLVHYIQDHLKHIMCNSDLRPLQQDLKHIKFIKLPSGEFCKIGELCHAHNTFFITFCSSRLLPDPWRNEIEKWFTFFRDLGFRHEVSNEDWIRHSKEYAIKSTNLGRQAIIARSEILLTTFLEKFNQNHFSPSELNGISAIPFIYPDYLEPALIREMNMLFETKHHIPKQLFCFKGSVLSSKSHLAALCKNILPLCCDILKDNHSQCCSLGIESPVSAQTIISNLKKLSTSYTCVQMSVQNKSGNTNLIQILHQHFKELNKLKAYQNDVNQLKETQCVAISVPDSWKRLVLVKPSQLVRSMPSGIDLKPFWYQVPPDIAACNHLLHVLGIPQEIGANHCVEVLHNIYKQLTQVKKNLSSHNKFKRIALYSYKQLVCTLRKGSCEQLPEQLFLPSEDDELVSRDELVFNDAPWYAQRLNQREMFKFLKLPPPDTNGEKVPPETLGVKRLSSLVCEEVHAKMESEEWACNDESCYAKDQSKPRCIVVHHILESLQSNELKDGLLRVYYSERRERPSQQFEQTLQRLDTVRISCVTSDGVHTVLKRDDAIIKGSESTDKYCLALVGAKSVRLFIAPHKDWNEGNFTQDLSKAVNTMLQNEIKNEVYLASMLRCAPNEIEAELDKQQVVRYDPNSIKETKYLQAGEVMSLDHLTIADSLLILNFSTGEVVRYYDEMKKTIVTAKVVQIRDSVSYKDTLVTLSLKERASADEEDQSIVHVSPACIFKILTPAQQIVLFSIIPGESEIRATAEPVLFAPISSEPEDLTSVLESKFFNGVSREMAIMRLIAHLHYVTRKLCNECKVVHFLEKLHYFLEGENPLQPLQHYVLLIIQNNLHVPLPAHASQPSIIEGYAIPSDIVSIQMRDFSHPANTQYFGGHSGTRGHFSGPGTGTQHNVGLQHTTQTRVQHQSRFLPPLRRTGQRSHYRPQRYRFQYSYQQTQPPPHPTSERHAQIWLDQAKMDYRAAMFMMGLTELTPVIVPPPEQCVTAQAAPLEPQLVKSKQTAPDKLLNKTLPSLASNSSESKHLHENSDEEEKPAFDLDAGDLESSNAMDERNSSVSIISSLHSEREEGSDREPSSTNFPSVVCFLCHEAAEKSVKGVMYAYCGLNSKLINCSNLISLLQEVKVSSHFPKDLLKPIERCVMQVCEHQNRSRYPNFQIPPCAPAIAYTNANAREALMATSQLLHSLIEDPKISPILKGLDELPVPQFASMLKSLDGSDEYPPYWEPHLPNEKFKLCLLDANTDEFESIEDHFLSTMPTAEVKKIHRIQNRVLWRKYLDKSREMKDFGGGVLNEKLLFHGSRENKPELICKGDASFDMRFSKDGLWGRGNYFAVNASYSNGFAYKEVDLGLRNMFAAWVLTGHSYESPQHPFKHPPERDSNFDEHSQVSRRYESVTGTTGGSRVYITYDNTLAYPVYLITYDVSDN